MDDDLPSRPDFLPPGFGTVGHAEFEEIFVPGAVPFTPHTVAWAVSFGLALGLLTLVVVRWVRRYRHDAYRRAALRELAALKRAAGGAERAAALALLPALLKRCALAAFARETVAGLSGERWARFLEQSAPGAMNDAARSALEVLVLHDASQLKPGEAEALFEGAERWMRGHRA